MVAQFVPIAIAYADWLDDPAGEHWQGEFRFRKKDNTYVYVMNRSIILRNEERRPVRIVMAPVVSIRRFGLFSELSIRL